MESLFFPVAKKLGEGHHMWSTKKQAIRLIYSERTAADKMTTVSGGGECDRLGERAEGRALLVLPQCGKEG